VKQTADRENEREDLVEQVADQENEREELGMKEAIEA